MRVNTFMDVHIRTLLGFALHMSSELHIHHGLCMSVCVSNTMLICCNLFPVLLCNMKSLSVLLYKSRIIVFIQKEHGGARWAYSFKVPGSILSLYYIFNLPVFTVASDSCSRTGT